MKIDGLIILDLTKEELENDLGIKTHLHLKKMILSLEILKQYHNQFDIYNSLQYNTTQNQKANLKSS